MTDSERDQIDQDAETYMRTCSVAINSLKGEGMDCNELFCWSFPCRKGRYKTQVTGHRSKLFYQ